MDKGQIVIVGAGPTGLMAANLLGKAGIATLVIEQHAGLYNEPRAITIDDEGLRICQAVGLAQTICEQVQLNIGAYYVSKKQWLAQVRPQHHPNGYPLISTIYQPALEAALLQGLARFPQVEIRFGYTVEALEQDEDGVKLTINTYDGQQQHIHCAYVLACDGGKSRLRQALNIVLRPPRFRDLFYAPPTDKNQETKAYKQQKNATQRWLLIDYRNPNQESDYITFYCDPARPAVSVQAPQGYRRWEFMLKQSEPEEDFLDEQTIAAMIKQAKATLPTSLQTAENSKDTKSWESRLVQIKRKVVYRFYAAIATTFSRGRVYLLGDAAHLMPPFGGQGMNSGLRDAYNLCWKLKLVIEEQASDHLLASYQQERYPHVAQMILFSSLLGKLILPTNPLLAWMRDIFFHSIGKIPFVQIQFTEMRLRPQPRYRVGCLLSIRQTKIVGCLLPQPYVLQHGERIRLDEVLRDDFVLVRLYEKPAEAFRVLQNEGWKGLKIRFVCVQPQSVTGDLSHDEDKAVVRDCDDVLGKFLGYREDLFVLVRPDHYIMGVFHVKHASEMTRAIDNLLGSTCFTADEEK